jgi:hypothetical protein
MALIGVWKLLRRLAHFLPGQVGRRLLEKPGKQIRFLRVVFRVLVVPIPRSV